MIDNQEDIVIQEAVKIADSKTTLSKGELVEIVQQSANVSSEVAASAVDKALENLEQEAEKGISEQQNNNSLSIPTILLYNIFLISTVWFGIFPIFTNGRPVAEVITEVITEMTRDRD